MADSKAPTVRDDGLQLDEHRKFQERSWVVERIAWAGFAVLLLLALLGLTGSGGPFSRSVQSLPGGTIDFPHILRWESADEIVVRFEPGDAERTLALSRDFAEAFQVEAINPEPLRSTAGNSGVMMVFGAEPGEPAEITLHITPVKPGLPTVTASIENGAPAALTALVLP